MVALLRAYEQYLADHKFIDTPGVLSFALDLLSRRTNADTDTVYLLPSFLQPGPLERRLIELLSSGRLVILAADPVYGLPGLKMEQQASVPEEAVSYTEVDPPGCKVDQSPEPVGDVR